MHGLCYVVYMYIYTLNSKLKSLGPIDGFTFCKPFCMQYFLRSFVKPYHYQTNMILIASFKLFYSENRYTKNNASSNGVATREAIATALLIWLGKSADQWLCRFSCWLSGTSGGEVFQDLDCFFLIFHIWTYYRCWYRLLRLYPHHHSLSDLLFLHVLPLCYHLQ